MKGKAGIGKVALYGREYLVKVQPREQGLIMYTLRHANEIRSMEAIDELAATCRRKIKPDEVKLAQQVIGTFEGDVDFAVVSRRLPGRAARDHRREDRGSRDRRAGSGSAAEGREPDGGAAQEPRLDQRIEEEARPRGAIDAGCGGSETIAHGVGRVLPDCAGSHPGHRGARIRPGRRGSATRQGAGATN